MSKDYQKEPWASAEAARPARPLDDAERARRVLAFPTAGEPAGLAAPPTEPIVPSPVKDESPRAPFRISPGGILIDGSAAPELIESVAYAALLAETAGELMGVGAFTTIEIMLSTGACVVARDPGGDLLSMTGSRPGEVAELKRALGLAGVDGGAGR